MASRSSTSTRSKRTSMTSPSGRSRAELPRQGGNATARAEAQPRARGSAEKSQKSLAEAQRTGRQSDQGGRPGGSRSSGRNR